MRMPQHPLAQASPYTTDLLYPSRFNVAQSPLQMQWVAACAGAVAGDLTTAFHYLDLGCGDGSTLNLLAACYPEARFVGLDINEDHIAQARDRAEKAGLDNVTFIRAGFEDIGTLELPAFEYITAAGVYSWVDPRTRQVINTFVQSQLRPAGLFGLHYSSLPGTAVSDALVFYLQTLCASQPGNSVERFARGVEILQALVPVTRFFDENPQAVDLVSFMTKAPPSATAHEVLNRQSHSFHFAEVHGALSALGLEFLGSCGVFPNYPELTMSESAYAVFRKLTGESDLLLREATKDLMLNTMKRYDLFRKPDAASEQAPLDGLPGLDGLYLRRSGAKGDLEARRQLARDRAVDLTAEVYSAVLDSVEKPVTTISDVFRNAALSAFSKRDVAKAIERLFVLGLLSLSVRPPSQAEYREGRRYRLTSKFNAIQLEDSVLSTLDADLASPILGVPVRMGQAKRLGLLALTEGDLDRVWVAVGSQQQLGLTDAGGKPITSKRQFLELIERGLPRFAAQVVPELLRVGIVEAC